MFNTPELKTILAACFWDIEKKFTSQDWDIALQITRKHYDILNAMIHAMDYTLEAFTLFYLPKSGI